MQGAGERSRMKTDAELLRERLRLKRRLRLPWQADYLDGLYRWSLMAIGAGHVVTDMFRAGLNPLQRQSVAKHT